MSTLSEPPLVSARPTRGRPRSFDREKALALALDVFWQRGYEPASIVELCKAMGINPPSLYAAFGNKAELFLEAVDFYDRRYWNAARDAMRREPDVHRAVEHFFRDAAEILISPLAPCGCLVVLAAINVSPDSKDVYDAIQTMRRAGKDFFAERLRQGVEDRQLPNSTDIGSLAAALKAMLEGMSIQARDGVRKIELAGIAAHAARLVPPPQTAKLARLSTA